MSNVPEYASIAVIQCLSSNEVAIEVISITSDTCELSGAWVIRESEKEKINQITDKRLIVTLGNCDALIKEELILKNSIVELNDFLDEANSTAHKSLELFQEYLKENDRAYSEYMAIKPTERKLLPKVIRKQPIDPDFQSWPKKVDLTKAKAYLDSSGRASSITGTPESMEGVLTAARLLKIFLEMWRSDEQERLEKIYALDSDWFASILPKCWLN
jgi:hypothetical protein